MAREEYPETYGAGEVTGAIGAALLPGGIEAKAATFPARVARGFATGGAYGALSGFGEGEGLEDSIERAGTGTVVGATLGGVAAPVVEGAIQAAKYVSPRVVNSVRGAFSPRNEAERQVATAIERDIAADPAAETRLAPSEYTAARGEGQPVRLMDMGGGLTRRLADVSAIASPEGATTLNRAINDRFETQSPRLADWLRQTFHYPDVTTQQEALAKIARTVNRPAYAKAYHQGSGGLWDEGFEQISQAPAVQDAIRKAMVSAKNDAAKLGFTPPRNPFYFDANGRLTLKADEQEARLLPNLQFWDIVKRNLDKTGTREAQDWARILRERLDEVVPSYKTARAGAARFFGAGDALEAGQNFVGASQRYGIPAVRREIAKMSPEERQLFQDGYVSRLVENIEKTGDRRNVLNQMAQSPAAKEEIRIALGSQRANELEARLRIEGIMDLARSAVQGNSWTVRRMVDLGLGYGGVGLGLTGAYNTNPKEMTVGALIAALSAGGRHVNANVMRRVADLLVSDDPKALLRGVRIVARNDRLLNGLRAMDLRIAAVGGEQAGNVPALQAGSIGRADQDQQQVPRPPSQ